ncbi:MAG: hypothetical protein ACRD51_12630 [Candidatus Acidiferrum sp.]
MLQTRLESLRQIFPSSAKGETYRALFDDFLANREFGLALNIVCDYLLEDEAPPPTEAQFSDIAQLYIQMELQDAGLLLLRDKIQNAHNSEDRREA